MPERGSVMKLVIKSHLHKCGLFTSWGFGHDGQKNRWYVTICYGHMITVKPDVNKEKFLHVWIIFLSLALVIRSQHEMQPCLCFLDLLFSAEYQLVIVTACHVGRWSFCLLQDLLSKWRTGPRRAIGIVKKFGRGFATTCVSADTDHHKIGFSMFDLTKRNSCIVFLNRSHITYDRLNYYVFQLAKRRNELPDYSSPNDSLSSHEVFLFSFARRVSCRVSSSVNSSLLLPEWC